MTAKPRKDTIQARGQEGFREIVYCSIFMMAHDANGPMAIKAFEEMEGLGFTIQPDRPDYGSCLSCPHERVRHLLLRSCPAAAGN